MTRILDPLSLVRDIHKGRRAIVVGSGPSVNFFDFSRVPDDIIFACNQSVTALKHCNYFCMTDGAIPESNFFEYGLNISDRIVFCSGESFLSLPAVAIQLDKIDHISYFFDRRYGSPDLDFNKDDGKLIIGGDVVHVTAHLSYVMGCAPIVLVGVDLCYDAGKKYCDSSEFKNKVEWSLPQERAAMWPLSKTLHGRDDINLVNSFNLWAGIKRENPNIRFLNANPKGRLSELFDIFENVGAGCSDK